MTLTSIGGIISLAFVAFDGRDVRMPKILIVLFLIIVLLYVFQDQIFPGGFVSFAHQLTEDLRGMVTV